MPALPPDRQRSKKYVRRAIRVGLIVLAALAAFFLVSYIVGAAIGRLTPYGTVVYGATFSKGYAQYWGLEWKDVYQAMLDDLDLRLVRLSAYWNEIEPQPGQYDFTDLDWQVAEADKRGVKVVLAMGRKLPRWPECYLPTWAAGLSQEELQRRTLAMIDAVVSRYRNSAAISEWQVENEAFLSFGICPKADKRLLQAEVAEVHALDKRPVLMQDPGELSTWVHTARLADTLGVSLYRIVWTGKLGYVHWPGLASAYWFRAALARLYVDRVIITELQAEPWFKQPLTAVPLADQLAQMNAAVLRQNVEFAKLVGFPEVYFWGVEWWYWLRTQGHPELWDAARAIITAAHSGQTVSN